MGFLRQIDFDLSQVAVVFLQHWLPVSAHEGFDFQGSSEVFRHGWGEFGRDFAGTGEIENGGTKQLRPVDTGNRPPHPPGWPRTGIFCVVGKRQAGGIPG